MTQPIPRTRLAAVIAALLVSPAASAASFTSTASMTWNELTISTTGIGGGPAPTLTVNLPDSIIYGSASSRAPSGVQSSGGIDQLVYDARTQSFPGSPISASRSASADSGTASASVSWNGSGPGPSTATATASDLTCPSCSGFSGTNSAEATVYSAFLEFTTTGPGFVTISVPYALTVNQVGTLGLNGLTVGQGDARVQLFASVQDNGGSTSGSRSFSESRSISGDADGLSSETGVMRLGFFVDGTGRGYVQPYMSVLAELSAVTPVPEPAEWVMMLAGLGLVGAFARRRARPAAIAAPC